MWSMCVKGVRQGEEGEEGVLAAVVVVAADGGACIGKRGRS